MYRVVKESATELNGRTLMKMEIVFEPGIDEDSEKDGIVWLARIMMQKYVKVHAIVIFGFSTGNDQVRGSFDRGRVVATRDGLGWTGDGILLPGPSRIPDKKGFICYQRNVNFIPEYLPLALSKKGLTSE